MNLRKITQEHVDAFTQEIEETQVNTQPLISDRFPFEALLVEFESGDPVFKDKLCLLKDEFKSYRKSRGDGNCFFRSFGFRYIEWMCNSPHFEATLAELGKEWPDLLAAAGFDRIAYEDFLNDAFAIILAFRKNIAVLQAADIDPSEWLAEDWRSNALKSNTIIIVLRMLVSAHLQLNVDEYLPFIYEFGDDPASETPKSPKALMEDYCRRHVEAMGVESDQIDIIAVTKIFVCSIEVVYLCASRSEGNMVMNFGESSGAEGASIGLLYRPGHYDIVYRS